MITFLYKVNPKQKRRDGTMNVKIIVTYKRQRKMLPTSIYCTQLDITRGGKLKNQAYIDSVERTIREYKRKVASMGLEYQDYTLDQIVERLHGTDNLDFFVYAESIIKKIKVQRTRGGYVTAINLVEKFVGRHTLNFKEITKNFFVKFEEFLSSRHGGFTSGDGIVMGKLRTIYRNAQMEYNDECNERISSYPLIAYRPPRMASERKRALPIETMRQIMKLSIDDYKLAMFRDLFIMSFCLMGMNAIDFYNADFTSEDRICYERTKTRNHRADDAYIEVDIDPRIRHLTKKYQGRRKQFFFSERYGLNQFRCLLRRYMKRLGEMVGVNNLTFYSARHSFATIAYNDCGVDKYIVHTALNHVSREMRITDVYIRRTFEKENEANRKVIDLLFQEDGECR